MDRFEWNDDKNEQLKRDRNISFEEVVYAISQGQLLDIIQHPNQVRYPNQRIYIVKIHEYVHLVPVVVENDYIFFKTIIPSRKATRDYLGRNLP